MKLNITNGNRRPSKVRLQDGVAIEAVGISGLEYVVNLRVVSNA